MIIFNGIVMIMIGGHPIPIKLNKLIERRAFKEVEGRGLHHPIIIMQQGASKKIPFVKIGHGKYYC